MPSDKPQSNRWLSLVVFLVAGLLIGIGIGDVLFYHPEQSTVPSEPRNMVAISGIGNVTLNWTAPSNDGGSPIIGYKLYRVHNITVVLLMELSGNTRSFIDSYGTPGINYGYYVQAYNSIGTGANSAPVTASSLKTNNPITPTGSFSSATSLSTTSEKVQFGVITPDAKVADIKIIVLCTTNSTVVLSTTLSANMNGMVHGALTQLGGTANKVASGDYVTLTNLAVSSAYSVSMVFIPTGNIIGVATSFTK